MNKENNAIMSVIMTVYGAIYLLEFANLYFKMYLICNKETKETRSIIIKISLFLFKCQAANGINM